MRVLVIVYFKIQFWLDFVLFRRTRINMNLCRDSLQSVVLNCVHLSKTLPIVQLRFYRNSDLNRLLKIHLFFVYWKLEPIFLPLNY